MKKSIIALAVAGALTAPIAAQADATLYGSLRLNLSNYDSTGLDFTDNASRIGIKGSTELFSGAKAIFQWEQFVSTETGALGYQKTQGNGGRLASIGITGDFGTVNAGRQWSPFAIWTVFPTDILVNSDNSGNTGYQPGLHRLSNTVAYISPAMNGLQVAAVLIANNNDKAATSSAAIATQADVDAGNAATVGQVFNKTTTASDDSEDLDAYNLAVKYSVDGLTLAASTIGLEPSGQSVNSVAASYTTGGLYVAARYQDDETAGAGNEDSYELAAKYTMDKTTVAANFIDNDNVADDAYSLEVSQKLGKAATAFVGYYDKGADDSLAVGYRVDF
ncbi:porin [Pontibacterium sinense]|nr:porin [Pontibacterium sinense]